MLGESQGIFLAVKFLTTGEAQNGFVFEHWTDGDQYNFSDGSRKSTVTELLATQWGPTKIGSRL